MIKVIVLLACGALFSVFIYMWQRRNNERAASFTSPLPQKSIYDFTLKDIDGKDVTIEQYRGKVLLMVNVASKCGFTPQYEGLEKLFLKYKDKGFFVLGFPANNFLSQEPGTDEEIKQFCSLKYNVTFPMFSKISVKGKDKHPLYRFLTEKATDPEFAGENRIEF